MTELTNIGAQMANVMFNLSQRPGEPLTSNDVAIMDKLRKEWDAARRATPSSECALPPPFAFAVESNIGNGMRAITKLTPDEVEADRYANRTDMAQIGCERKKTALYSDEQVEQIRREAVEADRRARANSPEFEGIKTQPASAAQGVKTWQERCDWMSDEPATKLMVEAMKAEIYDLRAQLAAATENLQTAVQQAWIANAELSKLRAQIARQSQGAIYACKGKGGMYEHVGIAAGAGQTRGCLVHVYRDHATGNLFYRTPADFDTRMELVAAPPLSSEPQDSPPPNRDGERYRLVRAQLSRRDFNYLELEGEPESELDAYCDAELAKKGSSDD